MPHCIIEHSNSIKSDKLVSLVFKGALKSDLFKDDDIKVRALEYVKYQTGNEKSNFVHVTLKILSGRNQDQKLSLSQLVLDELSSISLKKCSLTVEVVDMDTNSYSKLLI